jgi:formyltetrahydrofolate deformylase
MPASYILTFTCADRVGIVAALTGALAAHDGFVLDSQQYADLDTGHFFMRVEFTGAGPRFPEDADAVRAFMAAAAAPFDLDLTLVEASTRPRMLIAVSKASHCLNDLLHRWRTGALAIDIAGVVSNHETMRALTEWHGIAFHHLPVDPENRPAQEAALAALIDETHADYLVLARYMQVLSTDFAARLVGRCINIHHSFLPGFKGAQPYHRAHARP